MKKFFLWISLGTISFLIIVGGIYWYFSRPQISVEEILPAGPIIYARLSHPQENLGKIMSTQVFNKASDLFFKSLRNNPQFSRDQIASLELLRERISHPMLKFVLGEVLGEDIGLAIYPVNNLQKNSQDSGDEFIGALKNSEDFSSNIIFVTRVAPEIRAAELSMTNVSLGEGMSLGSRKYKGFKIHWLTISQFPMELTFTRIKDLFVIGFSEEAVRRTIDTFNKESANLEDDSEFRQARTSAGGNNGLFVFWNLAKSAADRDGHPPGNLPGLPAPGARKTGEGLPSFFSGFKTVVFSIGGENTLQMKLKLFVNKEKLHPSLSSFLLDCSLASNDSFSFIPSDILFYHWSNCYDFRFGWHEIQKEIHAAKNQERAKKLKEKIAEFEAEHGLDIAGDILPAFGSKMGLYLLKIQKSGSFPLPQFLIFTEVKDERVLQDALAYLTKELLVQREEYRGVSLVYFALPFEEGLQPAYAFVDRYLFVATDYSLIKMSLDAREDRGMPLLENEKFQEVNFSLTEQNSTVAFINVQELADETRGVFEWFLAQRSSQANEHKAFQAGLENRFTDLTTTLSTMEKEIQELQFKADYLETRIQDYRLRGLDITEREDELAQYKRGIESRQQELKEVQIQKEGLQKTIENFEQKIENANLQERRFREVVNPLLQILESVRALGLRHIVWEDGLEVRLFLKAD